MRWRVHTVSILLVAGTLTNCGGTQRVGEPFGRQPELTTDTLAQGQVVFMQHCQQCHPHGEGGLAPGFNHLPVPQSLVALQVRQGFGAMPAFSDDLISDEELDALTDYILALRRAAS
jgi:mono/diheme cytochrome c family protein